MTSAQILAAFSEFNTPETVIFLKAICTTQNAKVYPDSYTLIEFQHTAQLLHLIEKDGSEIFIDFVDINSISFYNPLRPAGEVLEGTIVSA